MTKWSKTLPVVLVIWSPLHPPLFQLFPLPLLLSLPLAFPLPHLKADTKSNSNGSKRIIFIEHKHSLHREKKKLTEKIKCKRSSICNGQPSAVGAPSSPSPWAGFSPSSAVSPSGFSPSSPFSPPSPSAGFSPSADCSPSAGCSPSVGCSPSTAVSVCSPTQEHRIYKMIETNSPPPTQNVNTETSYKIEKCYSYSNSERS